MDDFMSPEDLISSETLGLMERSISSITTAELVACVSQGPPKMWPSELDPATRRCIDDASTGWADGPPDDEVTSSDRIVERDMSAAATRAGYLVGRILLGPLTKSCSGQTRWTRRSAN